MGSEDLLLEAGKSTELTNAFLSLNETEWDGEPKFTPTVCREIGKMIVCRTYASPVLELCHLVRAASQFGRYEYFFWDSGLARSASFHRYAIDHQDACDPDLVQINTNSLTSTYQDGAFNIQFARMPVLSALLEFLLTSLGYSDLEEAFQPLFAPDVQNKEVSTCANAVSRLIYRYLREHLPTAQSQRKFRKILAFCNDDTDGIDDTMLLSFWQEASLESEKGIDFKTFESVLFAFIHVIQAVNCARDLKGMQTAASIGSDYESGEVDPDKLSQALESIDETISHLTRLASPPLDLVKFLNKQESSDLETLLQADALALRLPLSVLRNDLFSKSQARLTQGLRRHLNSGEMLELIHEGPPETYEERQITLNAMLDHLQRMALASLHGLALARAPEMISLLLALKPDVDYAPLREHLIERDEDTNVVTLNTANVSQRFSDLLSDEKIMGRELAALMDEAQTAYKNIARKGFKENPQKKPNLAQAFGEGAQILLTIQSDLEAYLERLDQLPLAGANWRGQFQADQKIFAAQFEKIYGAQA